MKLASTTTVVIFALSYLVSAPATAREPEAFTSSENLVFSLPDLDGNTFTMSDYSGRVVLVNFWASWCLPCLQEMPGMYQLQEKMKHTDFALVTINTSDSPRRIRETLKRLQVEMEVLIDRDSKTFKQWHGRALPTSYLLDRDGKAHYRAIGPVEWDSPAIEALLGELMQSEHTEAK